MAIKKLLINGQAYTVSLEQHKDFQVFTLIDSDQREQSVQVSNHHFNQLRSQLIFYANGGPVKANVTSGVDNQGQQAWYVSLHHASSEFVIRQEKTLAQKPNLEALSFVPAQSLHARHDNFLKSPLAGRVTRILISPGMSVTAGQPLLLIESMKMENEICAQLPAFIKTILIAEGNVVQPDQILIEFEKEGDGDAVAQSPHEQEAVSHR